MKNAVDIAAGAPASAHGAMPALPMQRAGDDAPPRPGGGAAGTIVVGPDQASARALAAAIGDLCGLVVTVAATREQARAMPAADLAVVDLRFGAESLDMISELRRRGWCRVLAIASPSDTDRVGSAMQHGATGIVVTHQHDSSRSSAHGLDMTLSDREIEVIGMVAEGRANKWIGQQLGLSALTVKSHLARIGRKLGTGDRARIVHLALQAGIIR